MDFLVWSSTKLIGADLTKRVNQSHWPIVQLGLRAAPYFVIHEKNIITCGVG